MKKLSKIMYVLAIMLFMANNSNGQSGQQVYLGVGMGFDYGGFGGKIEYLPIKYVGVFGGVGYNLLSVGWNLGATYKILPNKRVSPNLMVFYGYNAVLKVKGASEYDITSYGVTIGGNLDIMTGRVGKLSIGLFVPIRSQKFWDRYNDPAIKKESELLPIAISVGYNFLL